MQPSRRLQARALYARTPDNNLRVNSPDGFLHDFAPVGWDLSTSQVGPGGWWAGSDVDGPGVTEIGPGGPYYGPVGRTTGSPLTEPDRNPGWGVKHVGILPAVTRCTAVIVNPVVRTPWLVERAGQVVDLPLWISDPMGSDSITGPTGALLPAGQRLTAQPFWSTVLTHAIWWGRGVFAFIENTDAQPIPGSVRILNPFQVDVDDAGRWVLPGDNDDPVTTDHDGRLSVGGQTWRIVAVRGLPPNNGHTPEGVLNRHFGLLRLGAHIHRFGENVFASGVPSGYLKVSAPNMTQQGATELKKAWMDAHGGNRRSVAVLNATTDYTPISINPVDADTNRLKQALLTDVAHAFGLSSAFLDAGNNSLTYANISDRRRELVDLTLSAWAQALMETIGSVLPGGTSVRVNWPAFTSPDLKEQLPIMVAGVQAGLLSRAEARALLGLPEEEGPVDVDGANPAQ